MRSRLVIFIVAGAVVTACSSPSKHAGTVLVATETSAGVSVPVELDEYAIRMPVDFPAGNVTFDIKNTGSKGHTFRIKGNGVDEELRDYLRPGESTTLTVALKPGRYKVNCPIAPHPILGMRDTVTVTDGAMAGM